MDALGINNLRRVPAAAYVIHVPRRNNGEMFTVNCCLNGRGKGRVGFVSCMNEKLGRFAREISGFVCVCVCLCVCVRR